MAQIGIVSVLSADRHATYPINGEGGINAVEDAINAFNNGSIPSNTTFKLNGRPCGEAQFSNPLRDGDVLFQLPTDVVNGGVKGA